MDESELIRRLKQGDESALRAFQCQFQSEIFRYLWGVTHNTETTQELWIELCLCVWQNIKNFTPRSESSFKVWVRRIAHNLAMDEVRGSKNTVTAQPFDPEMMSPNPSFSLESNVPEIESIPTLILRESLATLSPRYQELLRLCATFCTPRQIAQITNEPSDRISVKLNQAAQALLKQIRKHPQMAELSVELPTHTTLLRNLRQLSHSASTIDIMTEANP